MSHYMLSRFALLALLTATLLPAVAFPQSQDSQSVAEAARRARERKKTEAKPVKVITDETLDVKKGDVQSAVAEEPKMPGAPEPNAQSANNAPGANVDSSSTATKDSEEEKLKKELAALKEQLKQAQSDLDLLQREYRLDQDTFYSNVNYASDTAGKQKLDDEKQQITDKREEVERLKAKLADLQKALGITDSTAPKP
jgi:chromosome condensin MukBEF ATPase and DNA-binding subunit MukB